MRILSRVPLSVSEDFFITCAELVEAEQKGQPFARGDSSVSDFGKALYQKLTRNTSVPLF